MKRTPILAALAAALLTLVTACGGDDGADTATSAGGSSLTNVTVAAVQGGVMPVSFRAGIQEGVFEKHGLDVEVETLATGLDNISAAVQGSADIAYSDIFGGLSARDNGFDVGLLAPFNGVSPFNYLLVPADSDIRTPADLKGRTIGIGAPPLFKTVASISLGNAGVDPADVKFTLVKDQTTFGALLETGQVDAINLTSPISAEQWIAEKGFRPVVDIESGSQGVPLDTPVAGWWTTRDWFDGNTETATKFAAAIEEVQSWFTGLPAEEQATYVKEQTKADPIALEKTYPGLLNKLTIEGMVPFSGTVDEASLTRWLAQGNKYAGVPQTPFDEWLLPTAQAK